MQLMPVLDAAIAAGAPAARPLAPTADAPAMPVAQGSPDPVDHDVRPGRQDGVAFNDAVERVMAADDRARVTVDRTTNAETFVSGRFGVVMRPGVGGSGPDRIARTFLAQHGSLFGLRDQGSELRLVSSSKDELGFTHFRYQQLHSGLPVFGQQLVVHAKDDSVTAVGGRVTPNIVDAEPKLGSGEATRRALTATRAALSADGSPATGELRAIGTQALGWYTLQDGTPRLAYEVVVGQRADQRWQMYVDAGSGEVLDKWDLVHSAMNRETVDTKTGKVRREGEGPTGDAVLDEAHDNAAGVYDFYKAEFGRDSIDDRGMKLKSVVHYGNKYNNAFWNGSYMTYGDGDGVRFSPLVSPDVVGHEMTHGVTERTAGLRYVRQSGALNESWSDVFGNLIEKWMERRAGRAESDPNWLIGEAIFTPGVAGDGLRSMSRPGTGYDKDPQPGHMRDYKDTSSDNGGVHINSGIPNKAAYEVAMAIGQDKLAAVWYRALTTYLTSSSQFNDAANVTVQSAIDLYGAGSSEASAVAKAWETVGLTPSVKPGVTG
jgi:bacillolysin/thermolysin